LLYFKRTDLAETEEVASTWADSLEHIAVFQDLWHQKPRPPYHRKHQPAVNDRSQCASTEAEVQNSADKEPDIIVIYQKEPYTWS